MTGGGDRLIIAGGGLAGCLAALALAGHRPEIDFLLVEAGDGFGGNHIWSFFDDDLEAAGRALIEPAVAARWSEYDIRFPGRVRTIATGYNSMTSERLDSLVRARLAPERYRLGVGVERLAPDHVVLAGGERIDAAGVIDARGAAALDALDLGWQSFLGREYRFERPHGLARPIVMDATVDQADGYRFVYCLPFSATDMLVEDTYYTLAPMTDAAALGDRIDAYVRQAGWGAATLIRQEQGVLPVTMGGDPASLWRGAEVARLGLRGGFFHPTTGYSLPDAVRTALLLARQRDFDSASLHATFGAEAMRLWKQRRFYRLLNRMLFRAARPSERWRVLRHFYRLDAGLVGRFYAGRSTIGDKLRILSGKPPVPVARAIPALLGKAIRP